MPQAQPPEEFFHISSGGTVPKREYRVTWMNPYLALKRNRGIIDWYSPVRYGERAVPRFFADVNEVLTPNEAYRGEVYPLNPVNTAGLTKLSPNVIEIEAVLSGPDTIVLNQNFHPAWRTDAGTISEREGLIAITITEPGIHDIRLTFRPLSFYVGAAVSLATLGGLVVAVRLQKLRRKRGRTP